MAAATTIYTHRGTRAVQRLVEYAPATGGLALWVRHVDLAPCESTTRQAPLRTDGHTLYYDARFERLPVAEQAALVAHAVLHVALRHPQRFDELQRRIGDADLQLFNTCADAIVNSTLGHLSWLQLPAQAVTLEALLSQALAQTPGVEAALLAWDVESLYRAIDDRRNGSGQQAQRRPDGPRSARVRALGAATALDLLPTAPGQHHRDQAPQDQAEHSREWAERLLRAHTSDGEFSMLRTLGADLPRSHTPWEQQLRTQLNRSLAPQRELSWSRPSRSTIANQGRSRAGRRLPFEPGSSASRRVPRVVVMVDVSGSIEATLMDRFACELEALTRRLEAGLVLVVGDDRVREVLHCAPGRSSLRDISFQGGGGTDFTPLLEEANRHCPDIGIVLTDLDGPAHFQPRWPVLWTVPPQHAGAIAPFGRKLVLA